MDNPPFSVISDLWPNLLTIMSWSHTTHRFTKTRQTVDRKKIMQFSITVYWKYNSCKIKKSTITLMQVISVICNLLLTFEKQNLTGFRFRNYLIYIKHYIKIPSFRKCKILWSQKLIVTLCLRRTHDLKELSLKE